MVLVVGGAGYIGAHVVQRLRGRGVVVLDDLSQGHRWAVPEGVPLIVGDVRDRATIDAVLAAHPVDSVVHLAAQSIVPHAIADPEGTWTLNVGGTRTLVEAMQTAGIRRLVFASSASVYGEPQELPLTEDAPLRPTHPYGASKAACEALLAEQVAADASWAVACLRFFNAAGASRDGRLGESHDPETHLIPCALRAARLGRPLVLTGVDHPTPDGTAIRDYVHVADLAAAHEAVLDHLQAGRWEALNVGLGRGHSVREVLAAVERVTGRTLQVVEAPRRPGDPPALVTDATRLRTQTGWTPMFTDLDTIVSTAWAFEQRR